MKLRVRKGLKLKKGGIHKECRGWVGRRRGKGDRNQSRNGAGSGAGAGTGTLPPNPHRNH